MGIASRLGALLRTETRRDAARAKQLAPAMRLSAALGKRAVSDALSTRTPLAATMIYVDGDVYSAVTTATLVAVAAASLHRISEERAIKAQPAIQASILGLEDEQTTAFFRSAIRVAGGAEMQGPRNGSFIIPAAADFLLQILCGPETVAPEEREQALADIIQALLWPTAWWD